MPIVEMPLPKKNPTIEELAQIVAQISETLGWILEGKLDSRNAREFGGWKVGLDKLQSKDGKVGMSTSEDGEDPIRYWAGDLLTGEPDYYVTKSGKMVCNNADIRGIIEALGGVIGGWLIETDKLIDAQQMIGFLSSGNVRIFAGDTDPEQAPFQVRHDGSVKATNAVIEGIIRAIAGFIGGWTIEEGQLSGDGKIVGGEIIGSKITTTEDIYVGERIYLDPASLSGGIYFMGGIEIYHNAMTKVLFLTATNGVIIDGKRMSDKADKSAITETVYVSATSGGPATKAVTFTNGVRTS